MQIAVYQEANTKGKTLLHMLDYPGCIVKGQTIAEAFHRLAEGVESYMHWREVHGFTVAAEPYDFYLKEEQRGGPFHPGNVAAFFDYDEVPLTEAERREMLQLMAASREDLLTVITNLRPETLELWLESPNWSITEILRHIASAERYYITRLFAEGSIPRSPRSRDVYHRLELMRESAVQILQLMTIDDLARKTNAGNEWWTARKIFRRFIEHEREHIGQILRILNSHGLAAEVSFDFSEMVKRFRGISWKEQLDPEAAGI